MLKYALALLVIISAPSFAQISFEEFVVTETGPDDFPSGLNTINVGDIDGDGDLDIVAAATLEGANISWYENVDGLGDFSTKNTITLIVDLPESIAVGDLDNDGDMDVVCTDALDIMYWFENLDGNGTFTDALFITSFTDYPRWSQIYDIDGDTWNDIVITDRDTDTVSWLKNLGDGTFEQRDIATVGKAFNGAIDNLNGDAHPDVVVAGLDGQITWLNNSDGLGNFIGTDLVTTANGATSVIITDLDSDGFNDIVYSINAAGEIYWIKNIDNNGLFAKEELVAGLLGSARDVAAADFEQDGDMDLVYLSSSAGRVMLLEQLSSPSDFADEEIISFTAGLGFSVLTADFNADSLIDVVAASSDEDRITWLENVSELSVDEFSHNEIAVYPNPTQGMVWFNSNSSLGTVSVINQLGQVVMATKSTLGINQLDLNILPSGMYFVQFTDTEGNQNLTKLIKQ